jgi:CBS domain-containing protein
MDIPSFLRMYPPFDDLDDERLADVVRHAHIEFFPEGTVILQEFGEPARFLYVVRRGAVEVLEAGEVVDLEGEGEVFGFVSLLTGASPLVTIRAHEDVICYLIDREIVEEVMSSRHGMVFLASAFRRRDVRALEHVARASVDQEEEPVSALVRRRPLSLPADASIRQAAEMMASEREGFVLLEGAGERGLAIVTDRDLRSKVLAQGRDPAGPAAEVASSPVLSVPGEATVAEVTALMLERGVHHVPVEDGNGAILGVVTDIDLLAAEQHRAFGLKKDIELAPDRASAVVVFRTLPELTGRLIDASVEPLEIAHVIAVAVDALTVRLLEVAWDELGDPPCPWAWLALGSEARQEQGLFTDQDNALMFDPTGVSVAEADADAYFGSLGAFVNDGLEEAGVPKCRAGVIAGNRDWRGTVGTWRDRFNGWIEDPGRTGSAFTGIAMDFRPVTGPLDARLALDEIIRSAREHHDFIRHLGTHAVSTRPPKGLLKDGVVQGKGTTVRLDIKAVGIGLITNVARLLAIMSGLTENRTPLRLRDTTALGWLSADESQGLVEAFELMWQVRLEHQSRCIERGLPPDDLVEPQELGPLTRQALKEAFRMIDRAQDRLAALLGVRR